jgi:hypothetical protein
MTGPSKAEAVFAYALDDQIAAVLNGKGSIDPPNPERCLVSFEFDDPRAGLDREIRS